MGHPGGQPALAADLLGYKYFFEGVVVRGQQLGRTLGFPTANLRVEDEEKLIPVNGVYAVRVEAGAPRAGMMNIGVRPTVGGLGRVIEVHLLEYHGDLYGQTLRVHLEAYLRPEQRFDGLEALKTQLERDRVNTLNILQP